MKTILKIAEGKSHVYGSPFNDGVVVIVLDIPHWDSNLLKLSGKMQMKSVTKARWNSHLWTALSSWPQAKNFCANSREVEKAWVSDDAEKGRSSRFRCGVHRITTDNFTATSAEGQIARFLNWTISGESVALQPSSRDSHWLGRYGPCVNSQPYITEAKFVSVPGVIFRFRYARLGGVPLH